MRRLARLFFDQIAKIVSGQIKLNGTCGVLPDLYALNFAKTGNPNGAGLPKWPVYDPKKDDVFEFRPDGSAGNGPDQRKARLDVIEKVANKQ